MMPIHGFLGTPASFMLDVIVCSLVLVVPALFWSLWLVRYRQNYAWHMRAQIAISIALLIVVLLFEWDMRGQGGFWKLAAASPYIDSKALPVLLGVHLAFSNTTVIFWLVTMGTALKKFGRAAPAPGAFSPVHKTLARIAVIDMVLTVVTGLMVYYFGFVA